MIHDVNGNISTDFTSKTIRRKPRPLSIIDESSVDTAENDVDNTSVPKIDSPGVKSGRWSRRLAVAPLQHPVIELSLSGCLDGATESLQTRPADVTSVPNIFDWAADGPEIWSSLSEHGVAILNWSVPDRSTKLHQPPDPSDPDDEQYLVNNGPEESSYSSSGSNDQFCERVKGYKKATQGDSFESTAFTDADITSPSDDSDGESSDMKKSRVSPFPTNESRHASKLDDIHEDEQSSAKRDLDKDQTAWRERVKGTTSVTSLPDKFRPSRKSFSSFGSGNFSPRNGINANRDNANSEFSGQDGVRFSLAGQRNSPDYLRNPNSVVTLHPRQLADSHEPRKLKDVLQRKSSWQGGRNSRAQNSEDIGAMRKEYLAQFTSTRPVLNNELKTDQTPESEPTAKREQQVVSNSHENDSGNVQGIQPKTRRISAVDQSDYFALKETANRLKLSTRRASTLAWKAQYGENMGEKQARLGSLLIRPSCSPDEEPLTKERIDRVEQSLAMLRQELISIRHQDQDLAKQFLEIRRTMGKLRWAAQCKTHDELLDEAEEEIEDSRDLSRLVDIPSPTVDLISSVTFLKHFGVTRMNISSRRFSTC